MVASDSDHGIRVSSSPSRPGHQWLGPSTSSTSGHTGPRAEPLISSHTGIPLIRVSSFPQIPPLAGHSFFPYNWHKARFLFALQTLHNLLGSRRHLLPYFDSDDICVICYGLDHILLTISIVVLSILV
jgi:hypothetical protein